MVGPEKISKASEFITKKSPGAYILSRNGVNAHYVGRSDIDLLSRITAWANNGDYEFFWFEYCNSVQEAFYLECTWFHKYIPEDNDIHPAVPQNENLKCPIKDCPYSK